jgi:hypothetical protein
LFNSEGYLHDHFIPRETLVKATSRLVQAAILVLGRYPIWISTRPPSVLTEVFCGFPQLLKANARIIP